MEDSSKDHSVKTHPRCVNLRLQWDPRCRAEPEYEGYTILDSPILFNGSVYIVEDIPLSTPPIGSIASRKIGSSEADWKVISGAAAKNLLGSYGGKISGVTFLSNDASPHNSTLLSLWRTYSSLDLSIDATGRTILPPPRRLIFARMPVFSDGRIPPVDPEIIRIRSQMGFHPFAAKAAFPTLGLMFEHDWADYHSMQVPFVFERVVIADRAAAQSAADPNPVFAPPFLGLSASQHWWEPVRRSLAASLGVFDDLTKRKKPVVTYVQNQGQAHRPQLRDIDHRALVDALKEMGNDYGYEVHVVSDSGMRWEERMSAIVKSTIMLGVHGYSLLDSIYMQPYGRTTLMEFFPPGTFTRDRELPVRTLGMRYIAWWNDQKYRDDTLPEVVEPRNEQEVLIDAQAVVRAIREELTR